MIHGKKNNEQSESQDNFMWPNTYVFEALEGQMKEAQKNIQRNSWNFSKLGDKYKPTRSTISTNPKHKKHKENYTKVHHSQIA